MGAADRTRNIPGQSVNRRGDVNSRYNGILINRGTGRNISGEALRTEKFHLPATGGQVESDTTQNG